MNVRTLRRLFRSALLVTAGGGATFGAGACGGNVLSADDGLADAEPNVAADAGGDARPTKTTADARPTPVPPQPPPSSGECPATFTISAAQSELAGPRDAGADADAAVDPRGPLPYEFCNRVCASIGRGSVSNCRVVLPLPNGPLMQVECTPVCLGGRRPAGLARGSRRCGAPALGAYFAEMARLEAASVDAFLVLRGELAALGAPEDLLAEATSAAEDETRHARAMAKLAGRFGGTVEAPKVRRAKTRSIEAMARENAIEGCVRETYGALVAWHQAENASDPSVRRALRAIARDETRHASLSWRVAAWLEGRLSPRARRRVRTAQRDAANDLAAELAARPDATLVETAGVPSAARARALAEELGRTLWT